MNKLYLIVPGILMYVLAGCNYSQESPDSVNPVNLSISFEEELVISESELGPDDFLILPANGISEESKSQIRTDKEGKIFLPDHSSVTIRVFDAEGNHLYNIGRKGSGPGEFSNIAAIDIYDNELVVYDRGNRRIVRFSNTGEPLSVEVPDGEAMLFPVSLTQLNEEQYLFLKKLQVNGKPEDEISFMDSAFFHLFDRSFPHPQNSFAQIDSVMDISSMFMEMYISTMNTGRVWIEDESDILFVPGIYDGRFFRFRKGVNDWEQFETYKGHLFSEEPVRMDTDEEGRISIVVYFPRQETFSGKILSKSLGVFRLNDGRMIHVSSQLVEEERRTFAEVFNQQGELEGIGRLNEFTFSQKEKGSQIGPFWKDQDDRFYFIDNSDENPVLRGGKIRGI